MDNGLYEDWGLQPKAGFSFLICKYLFGCGSKGTDMYWTESSFAPYKNGLPVEVPRLEVKSAVVLVSWVLVLWVGSCVLLTKVVVGEPEGRNHTN